MPTPSFQHLTTATLFKQGQYRYCPFSPASLWYLASIDDWHLCLISMSSSRCKSFSVMPLNLVSECCVVFQPNHIESKINMFFYYNGLSLPFLKCFIVCFLFFLLRQALIWEWTSSWWLRCQACVWGLLDFLWCPVLTLLLSPLHRNITAFFLNADIFTLDWLKPDNSLATQHLALTYFLLLML